MTKDKKLTPRLLIIYILLQGLQGVNLSQEQLGLIQNKVKTELLKQQAMARQQNRPPPTKVWHAYKPVLWIRIRIRIRN
jgi:hypothetical protein